MKASIYAYRDYKQFLRDRLEQSNERGPKARLASFIGCQLPYVSQVLNGNAHFSLEQAEACCRFLALVSNETNYFLNLVALARAGTSELKSIYKKQLDDILTKENRIAQRLNLKSELTDEDMATYYSSWEYAAVHIASSLMSVRSKEDIAKYLQIPLGRIVEIMEFLEGLRLVVKQKNKYQLGPQRLHVGPQSPFMKQHLTNWRVRAIQALDHIQKDEMHYSSVVSCSEEDISFLREEFLSAIEKVRKRVKDSKEESLVSYSVDVFRVCRPIN